jgi:putative NIF3 family GTP cyclohydrolase 1 type 2
MQLKDLIAVMEQIAPTRLAESWDNVGLLAGVPEQLVSNVLLAIDYTAAVAAEAAGGGIDAVIAYHPPLFNAIKRVTAPSLIFDAIRRGIALYSPHTALDVAEGGTNDVLADALGQQADVYLTGELRHHDALAAAAQGVTLLCTLHSNSERPALGRLMGQLQARLPSIHFQISRSDRDPFVIH